MELVAVCKVLVQYCITTFSYSGFHFYVDLLLFFSNAARSKTEIRGARVDGLTRRTYSTVRNSYIQFKIIKAYCYHRNLESPIQSNNSLLPSSKWRFAVQHDNNFISLMMMMPHDAMMMMMDDEILFAYFRR